jgi:hypothetical protein
MTRSEGNRLWTEGPWRNRDGEIQSQSKWSDDSGNVHVDFRFARILAEVVDDWDQEANANLIAAAPRLYETLDVLLNCLDREAVARLGIEQEVLAAVCALQQARGETND